MRILPHAGPGPDRAEFRPTTRLPSGARRGARLIHLETRRARRPGHAG